MRTMENCGPILVGGALFVAGCQFIAGVRPDVEVIEQPNTTATCTPDLAPFDILTSAELDGHDIDPLSLLMVSGSERSHVAVVDKVANRLVVRTLPHLGEPVLSKAEFLFSEDATFVTGRDSGSQLSFQGRRGSEIGQIVFPTMGDGIASEGKFQPFPMLEPACAAPNVAEAIAFAHAGDTTYYAATCAAPGAPTRALVLGRSDEPMPALVTEGPANDASLEVDHYAVTNGQHLILVGDINRGEVFFRRGASVAELATGQPIQFSQDPTELEFVIGAVPLPADDGVTLLIAHYTPPPMFSASVLVGVVKSFASLAAVPPPGLTPLFTLDDPSIFAPPSPVASDEASLYMTLTPRTGKSVLVTWLTRQGEVLLVNQPVVTLPDSDSAQVLNAAVTKLGLKLLIAWVEQRNGAFSVRGQRLICSY